MTPEQRDKLPKWARDEFANLERRLRDAERTLEAAVGPKLDDSNLRNGFYYTTLQQDVRALPPYSHPFIMKDGARFEFILRPNRPGFEVNGRGALVVQPWATNLVIILPSEGV